MVRPTALEVERHSLDLAVRHPADHLSPQALRKNKQLPQSLCLPGRSIGPTLERLDPRTWHVGHTRMVVRTVLVRVDFAPEAGPPV